MWIKETTAEIYKNKNQASVKTTRRLSLKHFVLNIVAFVRTPEQEETHFLIPKKMKLISFIKLVKQ